MSQTGRVFFSLRVTEKLKLLNKMTFGVGEKKDFVEIKNIKVSEEAETDKTSSYCTIKIGNETVSDIILSSDIIDRINKNPEVEFYYGTVSRENIVWKIVEAKTQ